eukprot:5127836-Ditylum_brightwellii.AAC.1
MSDDAMEDSSDDDGCTTEDDNDNEETSDIEVTTKSNGKERKEKKGDKDSTDTEFHCWDQHTGEKKETSFIRRKNVPEVNNISDREGKTIKAAAIFKKNIPDGEIELWVRLTSRELVKNMKSATNLAPMRVVLLGHLMRTMMDSLQHPILGALD